MTGIVRDELAKVLYLHRISDEAGSNVPEISAVCESAADEILARFNVIPKRKIVGYRDVQVQYDDGSWSREYRREPIFEGDER